MMLVQLAWDQGAYSNAVAAVASSAAHVTAHAPAVVKSAPLCAWMSPLLSGRRDAVTASVGAPDALACAGSGLTDAVGDTDGLGDGEAMPQPAPSWLACCSCGALARTAGIPAPSGSANAPQLNDGGTTATTNPSAWSSPA